MDERGLELVKRLIAGHIGSALRGQPTSHSGRGARLFDLHRRVIEQAEETLSDVDAKLEASDDAKIRRYAERALHRTLTEVETILPFLRPLMESVRRDDVPIGMLVALDSAIEALLPAGADPVVHFDSAHMYSTLDLYEMLNWPQENEPTPVAFFVPVLSPFNALMTPLLVHEIGHTAILQANLGSAAVSAASDDLNRLLARYVSDAETKTRFEVQTQLVGWVDELLCDSLATAICGPSYLFAAASFLPATAHDDPASSHPSERPTPLLPWRRWRPAAGATSWRPHVPKPSDGSGGRRLPARQHRDKSGSCARHARHWRRRSSRQSLNMSRRRLTPRGTPRSLRTPWINCACACQQVRSTRSPSNRGRSWCWDGSVLRGSRRLTGNPGSGAKRPELSRVLLRAIEMAQIRRLWSDHDAV